MRAFFRRFFLHVAAMFTRRYDRRIHPYVDNPDGK